MSRLYGDINPAMQMGFDTRGDIAAFKDAEMIVKVAGFGMTAINDWTGRVMTGDKGA